MSIEELLWRSFQSTLAKKLNTLPKLEQKKYYKLFSFRRKIKDQFEFSKLARMLNNYVREKSEKELD